MIVKSKINMNKTMTNILLKLQALCVYACTVLAEQNKKLIIM